MSTTAPNLGLHVTVKLTHDDPRLRVDLISRASLAKRGFSIGGRANVYHMLTPEHRLYIPFSLRLLQLPVDSNGKELPRMPTVAMASLPFSIRPSRLSTASSTEPEQLEEKSLRLDHRTLGQTLATRSVPQPLRAPLSGRHSTRLHPAPIVEPAAVPNNVESIFIGPGCAHAID